MTSWNCLLTLVNRARKRTELEPTFVGSIRALVVNIMGIFRRHHALMIQTMIVLLTIWVSWNKYRNKLWRRIFNPRLYNSYNRILRYGKM